MAALANNKALLKFRLYEEDKRGACADVQRPLSLICASERPRSEA